MAGCSNSALTECEQFYEEFKETQLAEGKSEDIIVSLKEDTIDACLIDKGEEPINQPTETKEKVELDTGNFVDELASTVEYTDGSILAGYDALVVSNVNNDNKFDDADEFIEGNSAISDTVGLDVKAMITDENSDGFLQVGEKATATITLTNNAKEAYTLTSVDYNFGSTSFDKTAAVLESYSGFTPDENFEAGTNRGINFGIQKIEIGAGETIEIVISNTLFAEQDDMDEETGEIKATRVDADSWIELDFQFYNENGDYYYTSKESDEQNLAVGKGIFAQ